MRKLFVIVLLTVGAIVLAPAAWAENFTTNIVNGVSSNAVNLTVGSTGTLNFLSVINGGSLTNTTGTIGANSLAANNAVLVTGNNSLFTNTGALFIGGSGANNSLTVSNGGRVFSTGGTIGKNSGSDGNAVLVGSNSLWAVNGTLVVGSQGDNNSLTVAKDGWVTSGSLILASSSANNNSLTITNGGSVTSTSASIGDTSGTTGNKALVTGSNSLWNISGGLFVGNSGTAQLTIENGGQVFNSDGTIAAGVSMAGTVLVTGTNSLWSNSRTLTVADNGTGALTVSNAATVVASNLVAGVTIAALKSGAVTVDGGSLIVTNSGGTGSIDLRRASVTFNDGTITVDKLILIKPGANNRSTFTFNGGVLNALLITNNNALAFVVGDGTSAATLNLLGGTGTNFFNNGLTIANNATLTGGGIITNAVTLQSGGNIIATNASRELQLSVTATFGNVATIGASAGATLTFGTAGVGSMIVTNFGTINMSGGTLRSGNLTNLANGFIGGFGTFTAGVRNLGTMSASGGNLILALGLLGTTNSGTLSVAAGGNLIVGTSSNLVVNNNATIDLLGGNLFSGNITNLAGATLRGKGALSPLLVNAGTVTATNGELRLLGVASGAGTYRAVAGASAATLSFVGGGSISALFNTGATVRVEGPLTNTSIFVNRGSVTLAGGTYRSTADLTNTTGFQVENLAGNTGTLDARLINSSGTLAANSGTLVLLTAPVQGGAVNIAAAGNLDVRADWTNTGTINIAAGGALTGNTLTNLASATGSISGSGFIKNLVVNQGRMDFGGAISNNFIQTAGSFTLSGNGTVTGTATIGGGTLNVQGNRLTNGLLVVSGTGVFTNASAGATVDGGVSNAATVAVTANTFFNGIFTNTGSLFFQGAISNNLVSAGTVFLNNNATITGTASLTAGTFDLNGKILSNNLMVVSSAAVLTNSQAGATLRGALSLQGGTISGATINNNGSIGGTGTIAGSLVNAGTLVADSGTLAITVTPTQNGAVSVGAGGNLNVTPAWANNGTIALNASGAITGGALTNATTSTSGITGSGFIKGVLVNQGSLNWAGTVSNNFVQTAGGSFTLSGNATITGNATIAGGDVNLQGNRLTSSLLVVSGTGVLTNAVAGGTVNGSVSNAATVAVTANTFFNGAITNTGVFVFRGAVSNSVANAGSFVARGDGTITSQLGNSGSLDVTGGTLRLLTAPVQNGTITVASDGTLTVTPAWQNDGSLLVMGGTVNGGNLTNAVDGTIRNAGTISSLLVNFGTLEALGGAGLNLNGTTNNAGSAIVISNSTLTASGLLRNAGSVTLLNSAGTLLAGALNTGSMVVSNSNGGASTRLEVSGAFVNSGTINFFHSAGTFNGTVVNSGYWITDPTTNVYESAFTNDTAGVISMAAGDVYIFRTNTTGGATVGSFVDISTNNVANDKLGGKFLFDNKTLALTQNFYAAGHDMNQPDAVTPTNQITVTSLSPLPAGYFTNFSLGTLEIANFTTVRVWDAFITGGPGTNDNLRAALYVTNLLMGANSFLIISSNVSVYFLTSNIWSGAKFTLLGGPVLANQGQLHQFIVGELSVIPEPSVLLLWFSGIATVWASRRRARTSSRAGTQRSILSS